MKEVFLAGRKFNTVALAALTAKLAIIDGVLMQSATKTDYDNDPARYNVSKAIMAATYHAMPVTGWVSPGNNGPGFMTGALRENVNSWQTDILNPEVVYGAIKGCDGVCFANVTGAGFEFDCDEPVITSIDRSEGLINTTAVSVSRIVLRYHEVDWTQVQNNTALSILLDALDQQYDNTMFNIAFKAVYENNTSGSGPFINMTVVHTVTGQGEEPAQSCAGQRITRSCTLWPASVTYPIMITNTENEDPTGNDKDASAKRLAEIQTQNVRVGAVEGYWMKTNWSGDWPDMYYPFDSAMRQQTGFTIVKRTPVFENHGDVFPSGTDKVRSQLAGLEVAFNAAFGGRATLEKEQSGYVLQQNGTAFSRSFSNPNWDSCNYNFMDPFTQSNGGDSSLSPNSIFGNINSLMFLVAIDNAGYGTIAGSNNTPIFDAFNANIYAKSVHYHTNYWYMLGACISTFICVLCVLPVYWGYWQLGRDVSLGPFESAHAFHTRHRHTSTNKATRSPLTSEASQGSIKELMREVGRRPVRYGQYTTDDGRTVFVVADPDQLADLNRDTKAEFREQMGHVFSRERSQRTLQTLKTFGVKVEEKRDST